MTLFLASVRDTAEAECALGGGADLIDLKEPANGALGAVSSEACGDIVRTLRGRALTSATIGDLPMQPEAVAAAVRERASLGVDYVKAGLFPGGDLQATFAALRALTPKVRLILVVFADMPPRFDAVAMAASVGAAGIMLDTAQKGRGSLTDRLGLHDIRDFVARAKKLGLMAGLAGSLGADHVPMLLVLEPDVIGFRGALCRGGRGGRLELEACRAMRALIPVGPARSSFAPAPSNLRPAEALC